MAKPRPAGRPSHHCSASQSACLHLGQGLPKLCHSSSTRTYVTQLSKGCPGRCATCPMGRIAGAPASINTSRGSLFGAGLQCVQGCHDCHLARAVPHMDSWIPGETHRSQRALPNISMSPRARPDQLVRVCHWHTLQARAPHSRRRVRLHLFGICATEVTLVASPELYRGMWGLVVYNRHGGAEQPPPTSHAHMERRHTNMRIRPARPEHDRGEFGATTQGSGWSQHRVPNKCDHVCLE